MGGVKPMYVQKSVPVDMIRSSFGYIYQSQAENERDLSTNATMKDTVTL